MIIVRINGGLGNQMFQYAIGRSLAYRLNTELKLDISSYEMYKLHRFFLNEFNLTLNIATKKEIQKFIKHRGKFSYYLNKAFGKNVDSVILKQGYYKEEKEFHFNPEIFNLKGDIYLDGYFQTDLYFKDIQDTIRSAFTVKSEPNEMNLEFINKIQNCNSIALHIRRGDYVTDIKTLKKHGALNLEYYEKSIQAIVKEVPNPHFFIFSDDPEWIKNNLVINYPSDFISHNDPNKGYEDLRLMTFCDNFIIANSTFSWWGAWLSGNSKKIVIAPINWLKTEEIKVTNLIPKEWLRI